MNKVVRRYIVLTIAILIPLLAAYLVGSYGYNSEKFGQKAWKNEFSVEYLTFEDEYTTKDKIERYMEFGVNNQYHIYDLNPVYEKEIKSADDKKLFDFLVYRVVYKLKIDDVEQDRLQYVFFYYNVQYQNIRDLFDADESLRREINSANVPTFVSTITEILDDEVEEPNSRGITQIPEDSISIPDYDADVDFKSGKKADEDSDIKEGDSLVKVFIGFVPVRDVNVSKKYTIQINALINSILDDTGTSLTNEIAEFEIELEPNPENVDYSNYLKSHMQDLNNAGYFGWVFKNYLWWISLIAFAAVGLITGSFYLVYVSEERRIMNETQKIKKRKR